MIHDTNKKHMWKAVKDLKKKFVPQYVTMKNKAGVHVPLIKRAESIAEYLKTEHWTNEQQSEPPNNRKLVEENGANLDVFDLQDLNHALKQTNANKQPGPDGIVMELCKWLDCETLIIDSLFLTLQTHCGSRERRRRTYSLQGLSQFIRRWILTTLQIIGPFPY